MFKRILLCGALALMSTSTIAGGDPAWGLIVKLKPEASASTATTDARAQALAARPAALGHARLQAAMQRVGLGGVAHRALPGGMLHHVGTEQVISHEQAQLLARQLVASGAVEWAVPNEREHLQAVPPNDPYFNNGSGGTQWWAYAAGGTSSDPLPQRLRGAPNLLPAWAGGTTGSSGPIVAVLDTGLISHEDLDTSRLVAGQNFHHSVSSSGGLGPIDGNANDTTDPGDYLTQAEKDAAPVAYANCTVADSSWHGTAVTGIIAAHADNGKGIAGANWGVRIMPVRVAGKCGAWESDIIDAMNWVAGVDNSNVKRADVINLSFGGAGSCDYLYQHAINTLRTNGVVVVVAAGNEHGAVSRPANCANVISVAALNRDGFKANYSNFGTAVTIATVGGDPRYRDPPSNTEPAGVWGPYLGDDGIVTLGNAGKTTASSDLRGYYYYAGTSMAAPIVSATVALMRGAQPALDVQTITTALTASVRPHVISSANLIAECSSSNPGRCICTTNTCGAGILDADRALQYANGATPPPPAAQNIDSNEVRLAKANTNSTQDSVSAATTTGPAENHGGGGGAFGALALIGLASASAATARTFRAPRSRKA
ncbi:S8 family serine peptidase [Aquabacterium sp.]|uniref:S8 family serine peptidase n=1 Tax=Aquabacterium sp. TaxID=1872578 RepID=UPI0035B4170A